MTYNLGGDTNQGFFRPPHLNRPTFENGSFEARDIRLFANVIDGNDGALYAAQFRSCVDCVAANNTIVDPATNTVNIPHGTYSGGPGRRLQSQDMRFINNIVVWKDSTSQSEVRIGADILSAFTDLTFFLGNNLWYDSLTQNNPVLDGALAGDEVGGTNPNLSGAMYSITSTSSAYRTGATLLEVSADIDQVCYATPPSIGAHEVP